MINSPPAHQSIVNGQSTDACFLGPLTESHCSSVKCEQMWFVVTGEDRRRRYGFICVPSIFYSIKNSLMCNAGFIFPISQGLSFPERCNVARIRFVSGLLLAKLPLYVTWFVIPVIVLASNCVAFGWTTSNIFQKCDESSIPVVPLRTYINSAPAIMFKPICAFVHAACSHIMPGSPLRRALTASCSTVRLIEMFLGHFENTNISAVY